MCQTKHENRKSRRKRLSSPESVKVDGAGFMVDGAVFMVEGIMKRWVLSLEWLVLSLSTRDVTDLRLVIVKIVAMNYQHIYCHLLPLTE